MSAPRARLTEAQPCTGCKYLHYINADPWGSSNSGWGCLWTGGHAIERCAQFKYGDAGRRALSEDPK